MARVPLTALLACAVLAATGCGDDEESAGTDTTKRPATSPPATAPERTAPPRATGTGPTITEKPDPKKAEVSLAVTGLVTAVEQGDATRACRLMGQRAGGSGVAFIKVCGGRAGVDVDRLPSSDELSVTSVKVSGRSAVVRLASGASMRLRRSGGRWQVAGYTPPRLPQP